MSWSEYAYRDADALVAALAESLRAQIIEAIDARGQALLVLAGGGTPLPVYRRLAEADLPWAKVTLLPSDERCVPHDHPACNFAALAAIFSRDAHVELLPLTTPVGDPDAGAACAALARLPQDFDAVLLGMGNDAHTASLFPGAMQLAAALAPDAPDALRIDPKPLPPEAPFARITLSAVRLRRARCVQLAIVGEAKREALRRAQHSHDPLATPMSALLHADDLRVHIHWSP